MKVVLKVWYKYMQLEVWTCSFIEPVCGEGVRVPVVAARGTCHSCQMHKHQCQFAGCVSQMSVKAVDMSVCKAVAMAAILESGTDVEV
jgi:hypothetical protein